MRKPRPKAKHPLPCLHLGPVVRRVGLCGRKYRRTCERGRGEVSQARECERCPEYEPDTPGRPDEVPAPPNASH